MNSCKWNVEEKNADWHITWNSLRHWCIIHGDHGLQKPGFTFYERQEIKSKKKRGGQPKTLYWLSSFFSENWIQCIHSVLINAFRDPCWPWNSVEYQQLRPVSNWWSLQNKPGDKSCLFVCLFFVCFFRSTGIQILYRAFTPMGKLECLQGPHADAQRACKLHIESPRPGINPVSPVNYRATHNWLVSTFLRRNGN